LSQSLVEYPGYWELQTFVTHGRNPRRGGRQQPHQHSLVKLRKYKGGYPWEGSGELKNLSESPDEQHLFVKNPLQRLPRF